MRLYLLIPAFILVATVAEIVVAQDGGTVETVTIPAPSLAGNLQDNATEQDILVYLPPSYASDRTRRYPVVFQLHGWLPDAEQWSQMINLKAGADAAIASGAAKEMIVVLPNAMTIHGGAMYSNSVTTGNYEGFVAEDVVAYVDASYRTLAARESRGLSGHSMGGYGTWRIAMKYPEQWSSFYAMSSCCLSPFAGDDRNIVLASQITTLEEAASAQIFTKVQLTQAAAWSPNPAKPPLYFDLPYADGEVQPLILAKWNGNTPLAMVDQYIGVLKGYDAIAIDVGLQDGLLASNRQISDILSAYGIEHSYETYEGDHTSGVAARFEGSVLPFFSQYLQFE
jgi:enterochelin esterase-like enzyme